MDTKVLIVSHIFPPSPGVGGRRWAKFAKYLNKSGVEVHVLTKKNHLGETSLWSEDIKLIKNIHLYDGFYPQTIEKREIKTTWDKIQYKFWLLILPLFCKGNFYDRAVFLRDSFIKKLKTILKTNDIKNVIVTGAPFNLLYYTSELKKELPNINLIVDVRDPWTWGQNYGFKLLSNKRKLKEKLKEKLVFEEADKIYVPSKIMADYILESYPSFIFNKVKVVPHGYDTEVIIQKKSHLIKNDHLKLILIGELYPDLELTIESIAKGLKKSLIHLDIFSSSKRYSEIFEKHNILNHLVNYKNQLAQSALFKILDNYNFVLVIQPDFAKDYISTKFHELAYANIPFIFIGNNGAAKDFININQLGIALSDIPQNIQAFFETQKYLTNYNHKPSYDSEGYNLFSITQQIMSDLKN